MAGNDEVAGVGARPSMSEPPGVEEEQPSYSDAGWKMMAKLGYKPGKGLGRDGSGSVDPLMVEQRVARLGLGAEPMPQVYEKRMHTDVDVKRTISVEESFEFVSSGPDIPAKYWPDSVEIAEKTEPDYSTFFDPQLVKDLFAAKSRFDGVPSNEFMAARNRSNPFEAVSKSVFMNRAAVKMANLDALANLLDNKLNSDKLYFSDVCAGPGGFSEYILWRSGKGKARGWGFTLRDEHDWTLAKFHPDIDVRNDFSVHYGVDNTGNIYVSENIRAYMNIVRDGTPDKRGVDLALSDGGINVTGDENFQEEHLKQLVLCQFLMGLATARQGGTFVCKIFDTFTPFTVGLLYIIYQEFNKVTVVKPLTSRPANSERYIIAVGRKRQMSPIISYLFAVNDTINKMKDDPQSSTLTIPFLIPVSIMTTDTDFVSFITKENKKIFNQQLEALNDIYKYLQDAYLASVDQADIQRRCFERWKISAGPRSPARHPPSKGARRNNRSPQDPQSQNRQKPKPR